VEGGGARKTEPIAEEPDKNDPEYYNFTHPFTAEVASFGAQYVSVELTVRTTDDPPAGLALSRHRAGHLDPSPSQTSGLTGSG
jgi:hypothetical protein